MLHTSTPVTPGSSTHHGGRVTVQVFDLGRPKETGVSFRYQESEGEVPVEYRDPDPVPTGERRGLWTVQVPRVPVFPTERMNFPSTGPEDLPYNIPFHRHLL